MHKKIVTKVVIIFLIMAVALGMTIGFSYVAVDTQKQHIAITEVVGAERMHMERFSLLTVNVSEAYLYKGTVPETSPAYEQIQMSIEALDHIFEELYRRQYTLIDGSVVDLKVEGDFEALMYGKLDQILETFDEARDLSENLLNRPVEPGVYEEKLEAFKALNPLLLTLSDELVVICLEEATNRSTYSFIMQTISVVLALMALLLIIWYLVKDFYKPIMKMKTLFKDLSRGSLSKRLKRKQEDEFASLFEDLNDFLNHLEDMMTFEDKILEESYINRLLHYIEDNFRTFIPFKAFGIFYSKEAMVEGVAVEEGAIKEVTYGSRDLNQVKEALCQENETLKYLLSPIEMNGLVIGWSYFAIDKTDYDLSHMDFVQLLEKKLSMAFYKSLLFHDLLGIVTSSLAKMAEKKDPETGNHLKRMAMYTQIMARGLAEKPAYKDLIDGQYIRNIYLTAPMHDIGKVAIKDSILLKPGRLTDQEYEEMKLHVTAGSEILEDVNRQFSNYNITYFEMARDIACYHHEKFDGTGYPSQIKGKAIPLAARICAIADVFDALGSRRPYKSAFPLDKCYGILKEGRGQHFDPEILDVFFENIQAIEAVYHKYKEV